MAIVLEEELVPTRIPAPPNFPARWEKPEDADHFWMFDRLHAPEPATLADGLAFSCIYEHGITAAARAYGLPMRCASRRINTYLYMALVPVMSPPEEMEARGRAAQEKMEAAMGRLSEIWNGEYLPEIRHYLADWEAYDLGGATLPDLLARLEQAIERTKRLYELHMLIWFPFMTAISSFDDLYRDLFGNDNAFDAYKLLEGFENKTVESGRALWQLSRRALAVPAGRRVLEENAAAAVPAELAKTPEGRALWAEFQAYLQEYGQRGDRWGWSYPSWIEDPTPAIKNLRDYVAQPDRDLPAEWAAQVAERERLVAETRERLRQYPQPVIAHFEFLLEAAQEAIVLTEDHTYWIDFRGMYHVRQIWLEIGRRLAAAGTLDTPDDVLHLTPEEIRLTAEALPRLDRRPIVAARRAEMAYFRSITPLPVLGTLPSGPPATDPLSIAIGKFFGAPPEPSTEPDVVRGSAGSPGTVRGRAKVIRALAEAGKLQPGDILVTEMTAPPWTPLFATVAAVVTDTGGILSHSAVVAREYRIPAVVGTGNGTTLIQDGQLLEVDGSQGVVRIIRGD
jgi:rifampicin phosphotransferase